MKKEEAKIKAEKKGLRVDGGIQFQFEKDNRLSCPDCGAGLAKVYIKRGDLPLFAGYGSCKCSSIKV